MWDKSWVMSCPSTALSLCQGGQAELLCYLQHHGRCRRWRQNNLGGGGMVQGWMWGGLHRPQKSCWFPYAWQKPVQSYSLNQPLSAKNPRQEHTSQGVPSPVSKWELLYPDCHISVSDLLSNPSSSPAVYPEA